MRTLKVFESISVDGYFADSAGDMSFAHAVAPDPEFFAWVGQNASAGRELLFGRKTYEMMEHFWTSPEAHERMPAVAKGMNTARKYVASRTIEPTWANSQLLDGDLVSAVRALKQRKGPPVVILGSASVVTRLGEEGLVDEYQFVVIPTALGSGRTVFSRGAKLRLIDQRAFKNGNVVVTYAS
jgi:dihydrofolate reductase